MSLSNLIKTILNIQDDNISFPEENYCQIIQKGNYVIKVFKGFLKSNYCSYPHCNSKNIIKKREFSSFYSQKILLIMLIVSLNFFINTI